MNQDDASLVARVLAGEKVAFGPLIDRYRSEATRLARRLLGKAADALDGRVARLGKGSTPWEGVLDLVFDRIVEAAVLLSIALPYPHLHTPALVLAATWYVNLRVFLAIGAASERRRESAVEGCSG